MRQAYLAVRAQQGYKRDALVEGLRNLNYDIVTHPDKLIPSDESLVVTWNLHGAKVQGRSFQGTVLVVENPYIQYDLDGKEYLAMAVDGHNGSGQTPKGWEDRLSCLGIKLRPWQEGEYILVIGQRGIGSPMMRSPYGWEERMVKKLVAETEREVIFRPHPGKTNVRDIPLLEEQMERAYCLVMWASNCATLALQKGIPVFYDAPHCVLERACNSELEIERPYKGVRQPAFRDLSWAQWNLDEIRSGEAYKRLIGCIML